MKAMLSTLVFATTLAAGAAHADGLYVGGAVGGQRYGGTGANGLQVEKSSTSGKAWVGYAITPTFALEAGAVEFGKLNGPSSNLKSSGLYLDAVATVPIAPQWSLLGRLGAFDGKLQDSLAGSASETSLKAGLGVQYDVNANVAVRGEWERYRFNALGISPHADLYTVGVNYRF